MTFLTIPLQLFWDRLFLDPISQPMETNGWVCNNGGCVQYQDQ